MKDYRKYRQIVRENSPSVFVSQEHFNATKELLDAIERLEPSVLEELREMTAMCHTSAVLNLFWQSMDEGIWAYFETDKSLDCRRLKNALLDWVVRYNLLDEKQKPNRMYVEIGAKVLESYLTNVDILNTMCPNCEEQVRNAAVQSMSLKHGISLSPEANEPDIAFSMMFPFEFKLSHENPGYPFQHLTQGWDPRERWESFENRLTTAFEAYKNEYREKVQLYAETNNYQRAPQKEELSHFEWFVKYQIQGMSQEDIRKELELSGIVRTDRAISKGINDIANLVLLSVRSPSRKQK